MQDPTAAASTAAAPGTILGIDLGTTNSALCHTQTASADAALTMLAIPQIRAPGQTTAPPTLPSFLYVPHQGELQPADGALPWQDSDTTGVVGTWARDRGQQVPDRVISSAKSWLCNPRVDRHAAILPWRSEIAAGKLSPVAASTQYLRHLLAAFAAQTAGRPADAATLTVLTVPASFDEVARNLTYEAAVQAGVAQPVLLEEPLAAFYAWLDANERDWRAQVLPGDIVLVCDVGGGTCDFSLIAVSDVAGQLQLERVSVGDHLLLGGDNMDLALAHTLKRDLEQGGSSLDHWQFLSLVASARAAKERLLSEPDLVELPIAVASRSASLFASTLTTRLTREQVQQVLIEGFLPLTKADELPLVRRGSGIQEAGLAYAADPAISRHLARFLQRSWQSVAANPKLAGLLAARHAPGQSPGQLLPSAVLFNGGVFKAPAMRRRVLDLLAAWSGQELRELRGTDCELAVARGAAYYGKLRQTGRGIRVQSGTARSYYIGLAEPAPAVPGWEPSVKGLCLVPQGTDEGTEIELKSQEFGLVVGEPVDFRFFSSTVRAGDAPGTVVDDAPQHLDETSELSLTLASDGHAEGDIVPVRLDAVVDEVGMLKVYMKDIASERRWNLEFNVRSHEQA